MSNNCSQINSEAILLDLGLYSGDLTSIGEIDQFLKEAHKVSLVDLLNVVEDEEFLESLKYILDDIYKLNYKHLLNRQLTEVSTRNNVDSMFRSPDVTSLFHTMQVASNYFEQSINEKMVIAAFIGKDKTKYVSTNGELNDNIKNLKNELFNTLRTYLNQSALDLYDDKGFIASSFEEYQKTLQLFEEKIGELPKVTSYTGNEVPVLRVNIRNGVSRKLLDAYNAAIVLVNFDNVIEHFFSSLMGIDYNVFNNFQNAPDNEYKYTLKVKGLETVYWVSDSHASEGVEQGETKLSQLLISSIKQLDKEGNFTGQYLETKDFYSFAALLKDFELVNYNTLKKNYPGWVPFNEDSAGALNWYLEKISDFHSNRLANMDSDLGRIFGKPFEHKLEFVKSLTSYFKEHEIDSKELAGTGSLKALFTQLINNSVGATYLIYNASKKRYEEKEMHKHKANEVALQNSIYAHMLQHTTIFTDEKDEKKLKDILEKMPDRIVDGNAIKLNDSSIQDITAFIKTKTGLGLTYDNTVKMMFELSNKEGQFTKAELESHLENMYKTINLLLPNVAANQAVIATAMAEGETESVVISNLIKLPVVREIIHRHLDSYIMKPLMNIETLSGEKIPVFKTATLTYNDVSLFRSHEKHFAGKKYQSIFLSGSEPILLGTGTKLELINQDENKGAFKWSVTENFTSNLVYDFFKAIGNAKKEEGETGTHGGFSVTIGNYADKNTGLTKIINYKAKMGNSTVPIIQENIDTVLDHVKTQSFAYYADLFDNIFEQYNLLFELNEMDIKLDPKFRSSSKAFNSNVDLISAYLLKGTLKKDLRSAFVKADPDQRTKLKFIEEVHYSTYALKGGKVTGLNQQLVDYYRVFSSASLFKSFVAHQEQSLIDKHTEFFGTGLIDLQETIGPKGQGAKQFTEYVGLDYEAYKEKFEDTKGHALQVDGELNPLVRKWLWVNGLFRNEYLFMTGKGEYMHPHKDSSLQYRAGNVTTTMEDGKSVHTFASKPLTKFSDIIPDLSKEMSGRLISMAKRNVAFTATIELPMRKSQFGVPESINLAVIEDAQAQVFNEGGESKSQDIHDGASVINYVYSRMVDASYPGKGYKGTKKQFGTLISEFGATIKKDAETVITNDKIRNSGKSDVNMRLKHMQMFSSIPIGDIFVKPTSLDVKDKFFKKNGKLYRIESYSIEKGKISIIVSLRNSEGGFVENDTFTSDAGTLFHIWEAFGGEFSMDTDGEFSEGSNDLLYDLVTTYNENTEKIHALTEQMSTASNAGDIETAVKLAEQISVLAKSNEGYVLKDKMIHVISNKTAIKSGSTNLNSVDMWKNGNTLMYSNFEHRHMGPQLDANHDSDGSEIREITQVISALAQNLTTSDLANEVYNDLATIIKKASEPYRKILFGKGGQDDIFDYVSRKFFDSVTKSKNVSLAKTIMESFPPHIQIPYSNQNFFQLFVKDIITRMNNELITRYYSGIGAILNPSHGIIQLYEDADGKIFTQGDMVKQALDNYLPTYELDIEGNVILDDQNKPIEVIKSNDEIINEHIIKKFQPKIISLSEVQPGDTVQYVVSGVVKQKTLNTIEAYYDFKGEGFYKQLRKVTNVPRDLKPSEITFAVANPKHILLTGQIIFGHPGIGKTFLHDIGDTSTVDFDSVYKEQLNQQLGMEGGLEARQQFRKEHRDEYRAAILALWEQAKVDVAVSGKRLFASDSMLIEERHNDFDQFITMPREVFVERAKQRHDYSEKTELWKTDLDNLLASVDQSKVVSTNDYLSDILPEIARKNIFDTDSVRLKYVLNKLAVGKGIPGEDRILLSNFAKHFNLDQGDFKNIAKYLNAWTQRNLELLDKKIVMKSVAEVGGNFDLLFGEDSLINDTPHDALPNYTGANTSGVLEYKFKAAELILPNINKGAFNTGVDSIATIDAAGPSYFRQKYIKQLTANDSTNDLQILLGEGDQAVYVKYVEHLPPHSSDVNIERDIEFYNKKNDDGTTENLRRNIYVRIGKDGKKLYTLPENSSVVIEGGKETVYIKAFTSKFYIASNEEGVVEKKTEPVLYKEIEVGLNHTLSDFIDSFGGRISMIVPLMNTNEQTHKVKLGILEKSNVQNQTLWAFKNFTGYIDLSKAPANKEWIGKNLTAVANQLGSKTFASWEKSQEFVSARIPSQSMQSFMEMKNVGYYNTDSNDAYVSVWQIWLQGSDFDIDKAYIIGYGFDKHSQYDTWTSAFNYATKDQIDMIEKLPIPTGAITTVIETGVDLSEEFQIYADYVKVNPNSEKSKIYTPAVIEVMAAAIRKANTNVGEAMNEKGVLVPSTLIKFDYEDQELATKFVNLITEHNASTNALKSRHALKNSVVSKIRNVISSPSNQLLANTPVDVQIWHDAVNEANQLSTKPAPKLLSSWDMFSMFKQQRDAAIGKDDVGIAANGLKVFFALSTYYNNIYQQKHDVPFVNRAQGAALRNSNHVFLKKLYLPSTTIPGEWAVQNISTISDVDIDKEQINDLASAFGTDLYVPKVKAALAQSAFTSAATDNAKELLMAKLNASVELASMHLYMMSLGITPTQIAIFMNGAIANKVVASLESNMFVSNEKVIINELLANLAKNKKLNQQEVASFTAIYNGAQEFKILAKLLGVNQKTSANIIELHKYLSTLDTAVFTRENTLFSGDLWKLQSWDQWTNKKPEDIAKIKKEVVDTIIKNNITLQEDDRVDIEKTLSDSSNVLFNGEIVSVIGGNFDFRKYMDEEFGADYRAATKKYYNLIKSTINIFDVIDSVPHFKAMIGGLSISHNILLKSSKKYNFVFNRVIDLTRNDAPAIQVNNTSSISNRFGNKFLPVNFGEKEIRRAMLAYDKFAVGKWLSSEETVAKGMGKYRQVRKPNLISFKVADLLKLAGLESVVLYTQDIARSSPKYDEFEGLNVGYTEVKQDSSMIVDLMSDQGIANFKVLMEHVIFEILKKDEYKKENNFIDSLRLQSMKNSFGITTNQIVSAFNLSQLNTPVNIEKFQALLTDFNSLESTVETLTNVQGNEIPWRDLFYVYNLVVNNEAYGDKRLTPLFEDYVKERDSLGYDYLLFSSKIDSGETDIFELDSELRIEKNVETTAQRAQINDLLFYIYHNQGLLNVKDEINPSHTKLLKITNPDFVVNTSLVPISNTMDKLKNVNRVMNWIKSNALVITFKCD